MSATATSEQFYCANCSDPVGSVDEHGVGRCCHNLANPWHRGRDGLYTVPSYSVDAADEDEHDDGNADTQDDTRPECPSCGFRQFVIRAAESRRMALSQTVSGLNDLYEDATLWYEIDDFEDDETTNTYDFVVQGVICGRCRSDVTGVFDVQSIE